MAPPDSVALARADIEALLPHRHPFLWVDAVTQLDPGRSAVAALHIRGDAFWVPGHFPGHPVLPGVLIAEALAQVAALAYLTGNRDLAGRTVYLVGMDKVRFRRPVRPGEDLTLTATVTDVRHGMLRCDGEAKVGDERVANGSFLATLAKGDALE